MRQRGECDLLGSGFSFAMSNACREVSAPAPLPRSSSGGGHAAQNAERNKEKKKKSLYIGVRARTREAGRCLSRAGQFAGLQKRRASCLSAPSSRSESSVGLLRKRHVATAALIACLLACRVGSALFAMLLPKHAKATAT